MKQLKHIVFISAAYLLLTAVVLPSVVQFSHIFEAHEHVFCGDVSTHLHEEQFDCDLTKFITPVFQIDEADSEILVLASEYASLKQNYTPVFSSRLSQSNYLRGPPSVQQIH
ncbi:MAG TPA: hypothetical protein DEA82_07890 [Flavobacteriaceae bacterium]|jgi:hypothetical protein|nr:hypothetical protein [Flavobacteriaceae bacterium]|tara:strand:- start:2067 stop:2402 length:336 start_codon:yes stop_codon:yes gene_type:complete